MNFKTLSWAIRHPIPIIVLFLLLTVLGIRAFQGLPINAVAGMAGVRHITSTITEGSSVTAVEKGVQQALQTLAANYPDIQITEVHNSVNTTKGNYDVAISTLLEGAALTVLVVWLFLRNWRATLVAAIALPL